MGFFSFSGKNLIAVAGCYRKSRLLSLKMARGILSAVAETAAGQ
jgi:hypothetical protein